MLDRPLFCAKTRFKVRLALGGFAGTGMSSMFGGNSTGFNFLYYVNVIYESVDYVIEE